MSSLTFSTLYLLQNRTLTEISNGLSLPWTTYLGQNVFVLASINSGKTIPLSVSKLLSLYSPPDSETTYSDVLNSYVTQQNYQNILASYIPMVNSQTGVYDNRLQVVDIQSESGWNINLFNINYPLQTPTLNDLGTTDDLSLTPPNNVNPNDVLISINGILHQTQVQDGNIWVLDGMATIKQCRQASICGLITTGLGGHTTIPITSDMVYIQSDTSTNSQRVVLSDESLDFTNSSVLLSVDGYLQMFNNTYQVRDNSSLIINTNKLDYINNFIYSPIQRYKENAFGIKNVSTEWPNGNTSTETINQGSVERDRTDPTLYYFLNNPYVTASTLQSETFLKERLTSPHSFIICLNNPWVFVKDYVWEENKATTCFQIFISNDVPRGTLFLDIGWVYPYTVLSNPQFTQHLLYVDSKTYHTEIYKTGYNNPSYPAPWTDITTHPLPQRAYMRELYTGTLPTT